MTDEPSQAPSCEHVFASRHVPGHLIYWVRICTVCHDVDWDDLDREIRGIKLETA